MVGTIYISFNDNASYYEGKLRVSRGFCEGEYSIDINTSIDEEFLEFVTSKENQETIFENIDAYLEVEDDPEEEALRIYASSKLANNALFFECERVVIMGEVEEVATYIKNNPYLKTKKLFYGECVELDEGSLKRLKKSFKDVPEIMLNVSGNSQRIKIDEYEKTVVAILEIVNKVKKYNYSPLEALMYAYDLIRDRFYVKEDDNEEAYVSRDLSSALLGDKIVCVGFANIFNAVALKLGINSITFNLVRGKIGHVRNLMFIKDEKYDIEGLYFFDPTFDCKKDDNNDFLFSYRFFAKTKDQMDSLTTHNYVYETYKYLDDESLIELYDTISEDYIDRFLLINILRKTRLNSMLNLINGLPIDYTVDAISEDDLIEKFEQIRMLADKPIIAEKFIRALYTVRRNQYYENPSKYLFDIDVLTNILINSKLVVEDTPQERLLAVLGIRVNVGENSARDRIERYIKENNLDSDIERVKFTRLLKTICEKKEQEEIKKLEKKNK